MINEIKTKREMEGHEEDLLEDLNSTVCTLPLNVQNVIEQVRIRINCQTVYNCHVT